MCLMKFSSFQFFQKIHSYFYGYKGSFQAYLVDSFNTVVAFVLFSW